MSGVEVRLGGEQLDRFVRSLGVLAPERPVVVGGLAVMCRLGVAHRVTLDVDSTFDRPDDPGTTIRLVTSGVATPGRAQQRVVIEGTIVDVIDTFEITYEDLPEDPRGRLFVCAHRYAWETGEPVTFVGDTTTATLDVATVDALVATKAHALRFGSRERRRTKRGSDLYDLLLLAQATNGPPPRRSGVGVSSTSQRSVGSHPGRFRCARRDAPSKWAPRIRAVHPRSC